MATVGALLVGGVASAQPVTPSPGSTGLGDTYFPGDGNGGYDVSSYRIAHTMRLAKGELSGRTVVRARATQALSRFNLDFVLPVRSVSVNGTKARFTRPNRHELTVIPRTALAGGSAFQVVVRYRGKPAKHAWRGERPWLGDEREVVAMGEPQIAAWWFPSNDHPQDKARFDISIRVPRGKQAIANGRLVSTKRTAHWTTWRWQAKEEMAPYLAFFAAGDFALERGRTSSGVRWVNAVSEQLSPARRRAALAFLRKTPKVIAWLERRLGPYPFVDAGGLVTALDTGFALENQTRPTYPALADFSAGGGLLAHELAHQWFGDLVAVRQWRDIWLNEGFASYFGDLWGDGLDLASSNAMLERGWRWWDAASFWHLDISDPGPRMLFDTPVYQRGSLAVAALRQRLGEQDFWLLLRTWLADRSHGSVAEFETLAASISGEDLDGFFDAWLRADRRPARSVENGLLPPT
ncbi:M1 family metallopeptidase [Nocardioides dubius]|uniref:Aminopeptidase N n=1 Tax=Nocardioides dubius TaxID=317019 RepID=A0ABP4EAB4_9ACTN